MNRRGILSLLTLTVLGSTAVPGPAVSQPKSLKEQIVGTWMLVSAETTNKDGSKEQTFGPNPNGMAIFEANGRYTQIYLSASLPKFASGNRMSGTPEENKAVVQGSNAHYGTWSVDEGARVFVQHIDASVFATNNGTTARRPIIKVSENELAMINPSASGGGGRTELTFRRAK